MKKRYEFICLKCRATIITSDLKEWKKHNQLCSKCYKKDNELQKQINKNIKPTLEELKQRFEILMNVREQYFSFLHSEESIIKELEEYFDVNLCEVFDIDLEEEVIKKHNKNVGRPYLHGRKKR